MELRRTGYDDWRWVNLTSDLSGWIVLLREKENRRKVDLTIQTAEWNLQKIKDRQVRCGWIRHPKLQVMKMGSAWS